MLKDESQAPAGNLSLSQLAQLLRLFWPGCFLSNSMVTTAHPECPYKGCILPLSIFPEVLLPQQLPRDAASASNPGHLTHLFCDILLSSGTKEHHAFKVGPFNSEALWGDSVAGYLRP